MKSSPGKILLIYSGMIIFLFIMSVFPSLLSGYSPFAFSGTGLSAPGGGHLAGTDFLGRDVFSRALAAAWISILIGVGSRIISVVLGLAVGIPAGILPKRYARILNTVVEVFMAIPALLLAMALSVVMGERYLTIFIAIAAGTWAPVARFSAVQIREIASRDFVTAEKALGASRARILMSHIMPAFMPTLIPSITNGIAAAIMIEATLSFLGLGGGITARDIPTWGKMINEGSKFIFDAPWMLVPSALLLTITVLAFNRIGDIVADGFIDKRM